jgi:GT2 family glycosyltransferase
MAVTDRPPPVAATVVISTRNRRDDLRTALRSVCVQSVPVEVLVIDDGSTDGTAAMVRAEFPTVRLIRHDESRGLIERRNEAAHLATADVIFSLDDDAEFSSPLTVSRTLDEFNHPRVGAVAIPHVDTQSGRTVNAAAPDGSVWCIAQFTGTAYAVRRRIFLDIGGFCAGMIQQGEEGDYCLRLLAAGYLTRLGRAPLIQHHESSKRNWPFIEFHGRRNDVEQAWRHTPLRWLAPHLAAITWRGLRQAVTTRRPAGHLRGLAAGWVSVLAGRTRRLPVPLEIYRVFRRLKTDGPLRLSEIEPQLPPLAARR